MSSMDIHIRISADALTAYIMISVLEVHAHYFQHDFTLITTLQCIVQVLNCTLFPLCIDRYTVVCIEVLGSTLQYLSEKMDSCSHVFTMGESCDTSVMYQSSYFPLNPLEQLTDAFGLWSS